MSCKISGCENHFKFTCLTCEENTLFCSFHAENHDEQHEVKRLKKSEEKSINIRRIKLEIKKFISKIGQDSHKIILNLKHVSSQAIRELKLLNSNIEHFNDFIPILLKKESISNILKETESFPNEVGSILKESKIPESFLNSSLDIRSESNYKKYDFIVTVALIGESESGKSLFASQVCQEENTKTYPTLGFDLKKIAFEADNYFPEIRLFDTSGSISLRPIFLGFCRNADIILIFFDITNKNSFDQVHFWVSSKKIAMEKAVVCLIGNKKDLGNQREVSNEEAQQLADYHGIYYFECNSMSSSDPLDIFMISCVNFIESKRVSS